MAARSEVNKWRNRPASGFTFVELTVVIIVVGILAIVAAGYIFAPLSGLVMVALYLYMFAFYSVRTTNLLYNTSSIAHNRFRADM